MLRALDGPRLRARILPALPPALRDEDDEGADWHLRRLRQALLAAFDEDPPRVVRVHRWRTPHRRAG